MRNQYKTNQLAQRRCARPLTHSLPPYPILLPTHHVVAVLALECRAEAMVTIRGLAQADVPAARVDFSAGASVDFEQCIMLIV